MLWKKYTNNLILLVGIRPEEKLGPGPRKWRNYRENDRVAENNEKWQQMTEISSSDRNLCVSQAKFDVPQTLQFIFGPDQHISVIWGSPFQETLVHYTVHTLIKDKWMDKVNRLLARYSPRATTTNQPTNTAPNEPAKLGRKWPKMSNLAVLGQKKS